MTSLNPEPPLEWEGVPMAVAIPVKSPQPVEVEQQRSVSEHHDQTDRRNLRVTHFVVGLLVLVIILLGGMLIATRPFSSSEDREPYYVDQRSSDGSSDYRLPDSIEYETEEAVLCKVPPYELLPDIRCDALKDRGHTNSYWDNERFLCRLNERPCDAGPRTTFQMDLGSDGGILNLQGPAREVWAVSADKEGRLKGEGSCFQYFWSENKWHYPPIPSPMDTLADYVFGSLECYRQSDDDDRFYIIIDGVLVDSCPKRISEDCRIC